MQYVRDAGGCCGFYIAFGFGAQFTEEAARRLEELMNQREVDVAGRNHARLVNSKIADRGQKANVLTGATLTDGQMMTWAPYLRRKGWRLVTRFYNSNSGNYVNVLHFSDTRESRRNEDLPFEWPTRKGEAGPVRRPAARRNDQ